MSFLTERLKIRPPIVIIHVRITLRVKTNSLNYQLSLREKSVRKFLATLDGVMIKNLALSPTTCVCPACT